MKKWFLSLAVSMLVGAVMSIVRTKPSTKEEKLVSAVLLSVTSVLVVIAVVVNIEPHHRNKNPNS
jgi:hypothetical protein